MMWLWPGLYMETGLCRTQSLVLRTARATINRTWMIGATRRVDDSRCDGPCRWVTRWVTHRVRAAIKAAETTGSGHRSGSYTWL